jgi:acyl-CoA synthetase (AMP-forming)/AMP-acid ligase II
MEERIWHRAYAPQVPPSIDYEPIPLPEALQRTAMNFPDTVKAFIVRKPGESLTEEEVVRYCKENLAAYKVPKLIEFVEDLAKSAFGKVLRRELRDMELGKRKTQPYGIASCWKKWEALQDTGT